MIAQQEPLHYISASFMRAFYYESVDPGIIFVGKPHAVIIFYSGSVNNGNFSAEGKMWREKAWSCECKRGRKRRERKEKCLSTKKA